MRHFERHVIGFLLKHCGAGCLGGLVLGWLIVRFDVAGLGTMIATSPDKYLALGMLFFGLFITFGSIAMAVGIMSMGEERDSDPPR